MKRIFGILTLAAACSLCISCSDKKKSYDDEDDEEENEERVDKKEKKGPRTANNSRNTGAEDIYEVDDWYDDYAYEEAAAPAYEENRIDLSSNTSVRNALIGTWNANDFEKFIGDVEFDSQNWKMTFTSSTCNLTGDAQIVQDGITVKFKMILPIDYTLDAPDIYLSFNTKNMKIQIKDIALTPELQSQMDEAGITKNQLKEIMDDSIQESLSENEGESNSGTSTITVLTEHKFTMRDPDGTTITLTR